MKKTLIPFALLASVSGNYASAETLLDCAGIADGLHRLACYDDLARDAGAVPGEVPDANHGRPNNFLSSLPAWLVRCPML